MTGPVPESSAGVRAFVALRLEADAERRVERALEALRARQPPRLACGWVKPAQLHLTLKFLGDVEPSALDALAAAVEGSVRAAPPGLVRVRGYGAFPDVRHARVLWIGLDDDGALARLASRLDDALEPLGVSRETRRFSPHITLARLRGPAAVGAWLEGAGPADLGEARAASCVLYRSRLAADGSVYTAFHTVSLDEPTLS